MTPGRNVNAPSGRISPNQRPERPRDARPASTRVFHRGEDDDSTRAITWRDMAACAGEPPETFVPTLLERGQARPSTTLAERIAHALSFCAQCPVTCECLTFALENDEHGIWGGTLDEERDAMRKSGTFKQKCPCCESTNVITSGGFLSRECLTCSAKWR